MINFKDFQKIDLRVGEIIEAEKVKGADKLLKLQVDLGEEKRQLVAGIASAYNPDQLKGRQIIVVANLESKKLMGVESQGMILAADNQGIPVIITPSQKVPAGSKVK